MSSCKHDNFQSNVAIVKLSESGKIVAEIRIYCVDCGLPMQFKGLPAGYNVNGATTSIDALELRIGICPQGEIPSPLEKFTGIDRKPYN